MRIPTTPSRAPEQSPRRANQAIRARTDSDVRAYGTAGEAAISLRLRELEREWDMERALEAHAAAAILIGTALSLFKRRWAVLPGMAASFLMQHAVQGWCPPVEVFRRLGVRTAREIDEERMALKALRGDLGKSVMQEPVEDVLQAVRR